MILTFLGASCAQSCPVVVGEVTRALRLLSDARIRPAVVIVNTDPQHLAPVSADASLAKGQLSSLSSATFLTGPLQEIEQTWHAYGVTVEFDRSTQALAYTNVIDIIDSSKKLRFSLVPFDNESYSGTATLPAPQINEFRPVSRTTSNR